MQMGSIVVAGFRRVQEVSRVLEEYLKLTSSAKWSEKVKKIRFSLYKLEKDVLIN